MRAASLPINIEITPEIAARVSPELLVAVAEGQASEIASGLGIKSLVAVDVRTSSDPVASAEPVRVWTNGWRCRCPDDAASRVLSGLAQSPLEALAGSEQIFDQCTDEERLPLLVAGICAEAIRSRPSVLLGDAEAAQHLPSDWVSDAGSAAWGDSWPQVLREVLDLRISLAGLSDLGHAPWPQDATETELVEALIALLKPDAVEIRLSSMYLHSLTIDLPSDGADAFSLMRARLGEELGLEIPLLRLVVDETLGSRSAVFRINHLPSLPMPGLQEDMLFVPESPERLRIADIEGEAILGPAGRPGTQLKATERAELERWGLIPAGPLDYLALQLETALRRHAACFVDASFVERRMALLSEWSPALVRAARSLDSVPLLPGLLRALIGEGVSIRNLRRILERLVDETYGFLVTSVGPGETDGAVDARHAGGLSARAAFVRLGLDRQLFDQHARGTETLVAYLVGPDIESRLRERDQPAEDECDRIINAVRNEMRLLPPSAATPVLLTTGVVRAVLRAAICEALPQVAVLAVEELPAAANVQPVARISLDALETAS